MMPVMNHTAEESAAPRLSAGRPPERLALPGGLALRRRGTADAAAVNETVIRNLEHLRPWMEWAKSAPSLARTTEMTQLGRQAWEDGTDYLFVVDRESAPGGVLGMFGLHSRVGPGALEIGYWVDAAHTGRGIATAGAAALTAAALALPGIERVEIHCDEANLASAAVPRKLGYRLDRIRDAGITAPAETGRKMIWVTDRPVSAA